MLRAVRMKTYALFSSTANEPLQTYEGEEMVQNKEFVSTTNECPEEGRSHYEAGSSCCDSPWRRPLGETNLRASFRCSWKQNRLEPKWRGAFSCDGRNHD